MSTWSDERPPRRIRIVYFVAIILLYFITSYVFGVFFSSDMDAKDMAVVLGMIVAWIFLSYCFLLLLRRMKEDELMSNDVISTYYSSMIGRPRR